MYAWVCGMGMWHTACTDKWRHEDGQLLQHSLMPALSRVAQWYRSGTATAMWSTVHCVALLYIRVTMACQSLLARVSTHDRVIMQLSAELTEPQPLFIRAVRLGSDHAHQNV